MRRGLEFVADLQPDLALFEFAEIAAAAWAGAAEQLREEAEARRPFLAADRDRRPGGDGIGFAVQAVGPVGVDAGVARFDPRIPARREPIGEAGARRELQLLSPILLVTSARAFLKLMLPLRLEGEVPGPEHAAVEKLLAEDRLELELIFGALFALDAVDARPARLSIEREPDPVPALVEQAIFEFDARALEREVAVHRPDLLEAADVVARQVRVSRHLG